MEEVELTRRELLLAFLGVACSRSSRRPPLPPGEIVGASHEFGHRLRTPQNIVPTDWSNHDVVIVGAGVAGLAAAWRFKHADFNDVVVLELEEVAGGTSRSGRGFPWGAHYVPVPLREDRALTRVLSEMGVLESTDPPTAAEQFIVRDPEERVFYRGRWYEGLYLAAGASADDLRQYREFEAEIAKWVAWRDGRGRRAFTIPSSLSSDDADVMALDKLSMAEWMDAHRWTSPRLRWYVDYACRDDYGARLADTSAWAGIFYFASRVAEPGKESEPLITWPEGNGRLIAHLGKSARVDTGWLVVSVAPTDAGADIVALSRDGRHARGIHAKHVVFAAPQFIAARVIRDYPRDVHEFMYGSWLVANLTLKDRPASVGFPLSWDNVLYESPALGYIVATHQIGRDYGPTTLTYYYAMCDHDPRTARSRLLSLTRDQCAEIVLSDLERAHPEIRALAQRLDVMRWGHAMIRPHPGFINSAARRSASEAWRNIHFANADLSGVALFEEALDHGVRAAEEILRATRGDVVSFV
ncbi:MAG TPA: FAD-dependent oxidoreductase [Thermoanaerobaculia bacterium]|nr:FAD-dependent oxidoreductase [Thermoanaerobaculia bacterium]